MSSHYNQSYTKEQIIDVLQRIQDCVTNNRYIISRYENRQENAEFRDKYNLTSRKDKRILLDLKVEDFCYTLQNTNLGYEHEILHVFCPQVMLFNFDGDEELIDIYIKINMINEARGERLVIISFHKRNKPIDYLFK